MTEVSDTSKSISCTMSFKLRCMDPGMLQSKLAEFKQMLFELSENDLTLNVHWEESTKSEETGSKPIETPYYYGPKEYKYNIT